MILGMFMETRARSCVYVDVVAAPLFKKMSFSSNSLWSFHTFDLDHKYRLLVQTEETAMSCKNSRKKNHQALAWQSREQPLSLPKLE